MGLFRKLLTGSEWTGGASTSFRLSLEQSGSRKTVFLGISGDAEGRTERKWHKDRSEETILGSATDSLAKSLPGSRPHFPHLSNGNITHLTGRYEELNMLNMLVLVKPFETLTPL